MARHPYHLLDVFADRPLAGNPLAVVHDADGLGAELMLAFARETRLSETSFVQSPIAAEADYRNRIWTVGGEIPFAGHPSLGTAVAVARRAGTDQATYLQQTGAGCQEVATRRLGPDEYWASVLQDPASFGAEMDPAPLLDALGLAATDGDPALPPQVVSTGLPTLLLPLASPATVSRAVWQGGPLEATLLGEARTLYLVSVDPSPGPAHARCLVLFEGVAEDPATGSAAGALCAYLASRTGRRSVEVAQGVDMGRPSTLVAESVGDAVRVSGPVVVVAEGHVLFA